MSAGGTTKLVGELHGRIVHGRRIAVLAKHIAGMIPPGSRLLDVGCGDGTLAAVLAQLVPGLNVQGVEVHARPSCAVECKLYDGQHLPFPDNSVDVCLFVDVLHHMLDPEPILRDARRVSREYILIKDHLAENSFDHLTLRLMDWVGNRPHGVTLPYHYLSQARWDDLYRAVGLVVVRTERSVPLYPAPFSLLFGRGLHFISLLRKAS
ncbi:MAG: class I SAM-dependent methyltransferase [Candidatus Acidiferrales bacterium]